MADSIYLLQADNSLVEVSQTPFDLERDIQVLLGQHPELIPGSQIDPETPRRWLVIRNEAGIPHEEGGADWWAIDHLLLDQDGVPTFVEVKRSSDTRIRREVVAQMLEYAANGTAYWQVDTLRSWFEETERLAGRDPEATLQTFLLNTSPDAEEFWVRVQVNLQGSRVRCIIVADAIPPTLRRLVEFLNEHLDTVQVLAVEVPQYVSKDRSLKALVPRLVGQTAKAQAVKGSPPREKQPWDEERFMAAVSQRAGAQAENVCRDLLAWCRSHVDRVDWGSGSQDGSMIAVVHSMPINQVPFTVWTYGKIEIDFQYLRPYPPFNDENLRREFMNRLNEIPGVQLPLERLNFRPAIACQTLVQDSERQHFYSVLEWAVALIRGAK